MGRPDYIFGQFQEITRCATRGRGLLYFSTTDCSVLDLTEVAISLRLQQMCLVVKSSIHSFIHSSEVMNIEGLPSLIQLTTRNVCSTLAVSVSGSNTSARCVSSGFCSTNAGNWVVFTSFSNTLYFPVDTN